MFEQFNEQWETSLIDGPAYAIAMHGKGTPFHDETLQALAVRYNEHENYLAWLMRTHGYTERQAYEYAEREAIRYAGSSGIREQIERGGPPPPWLER